LVLAMIPPANAQLGASRPPAVGVMEAVTRPITPTNEFLGRIEATNRVNVVPRVTAFLEKRNFVEGSEVKKGDLLYQLERGPFEADLKSKQAQVAQLQATLANARLTTERAKALLGGPARQQSTYDAALANQRSLEAQSQAAQPDLSRRP
jgi:membrane fusion protein (multidrug efflux system)